MALYTKESKDRVRDAVDFVELVSARTDLRRAGPARYEGLCPFHEERTPSFGIDPTQKVYYCFGCQASGDLFTFVQESEGLDFRGALELLAERYNVELELEEEDPREAENRRKRRERLLELLSRTASYYERCLWESAEALKARDYLQERGLGEEILREFRVGYAPSAWDRVLLASRRGRLLRAGALRDGPGPALARERQALRPLPGPDHLPPVGHSRARPGLRRPGAAGRRPCRVLRQAAEVSEHLRHRRLPQGNAPLRGRSGPIACRQGRLGDPLRGLHRRDRAASGGPSKCGWLDGHGADGRPGRRAGPDGADGPAGTRRGQRRAGGDAEGLDPCGQTEARAAGRPAAGRNGSGRARPARGCRGDERPDRQGRPIRPLPRRAGPGGRRRREPRGPGQDPGGSSPGLLDPASQRHEDGADEDGLESSGPPGEPGRAAAGRACRRVPGGERGRETPQHRLPAARRRPAAGRSPAGATPSGHSWLSASPRPRRGQWRWRAWTSTRTSPATC